MNKFYFWLLSIILLSSCNKKEEQIYPDVRDIHEFVYSAVTVQPDSLYKVYASVNGILEANLVEEGDLVNKGSPILQIIATSPQLNADNTRLSFELAKKNYQGNATVLDGIVEEMAAAQLKLENDSINYFRLKKLWDFQIGTKADLDAAQLAYQVSAKNLNLLQNRYQRTKLDLEIQIAQAQNTYKNSLVVQKDFTVKSTITGKVYALYKKKGEIVNTIEPIASLGSASKFILEMLVDEVDIVKIKNGQRVLINLESYPDRVFIAKVSKIYPKKDERNQTFKVEAIFEDPPGILYPGLSGEANIEVASKKNALVIPKKYLRADNKVLLDEGPAPVITGLQTLDSIEIISGIDANTAIYRNE